MTRILRRSFSSINRDVFKRFYLVILFYFFVNLYYTLVSKNQNLKFDRRPPVHCFPGAIMLPNILIFTKLYGF